jgi:hypothetical protein
LDISAAAVSVFQIKARTVKRDGDTEGEKSVWTVGHAGERLPASEKPMAGKGDDSSAAATATTMTMTTTQAIDCSDQVSLLVYHRWPGLCDLKKSR